MDLLATTDARSAVTTPGQDDLLKLPSEIRDLIYAGCAESRIILIGQPSIHSHNKLRYVSKSIRTDFDNYLAVRSVHIATNIFSFELEAGNFSAKSQPNQQASPCQHSMERWLDWTKYVANCTSHLRCLTISTPYFSCTFRFPEATCKIRLKSYLASSLNTINLRNEIETTAHEHLEKTLFEIRGKRLGTVVDLHRILRATMETMVLMCKDRMYSRQDETRVTLRLSDVEQHERRIRECLGSRTGLPGGCRCADLFGLVPGSENVFEYIDGLCRDKDM